MIEVKNLSKTYGKIKAVKNLSFSVDKGEILGFLGPNGAGKTTTMKMITGYIPPTEGSVLVDGFDVMDNDMEVKKRIGYLPENPPLYNDMTVEEYLRFAAELKGLEKWHIKARIDETLEMLNIEDVRKRLIRNLSKGYKQRIGLAQAIIGNPAVLILDEPTVGLDPNQIAEIRDLVKKLSKDRTIILSTHILSEVSQLCSRVVIINKGEIAAVDTTENLTERFRESNAIQTRIIGPSHEVIGAIKAINGVNRADILGQKEEGTVDYSIESGKNVDIRPELFKKMAEIGYQIIELKTVELSLEDVFAHITALSFADDNQGQGQVEAVAPKQGQSEAPDDLNKTESYINTEEQMHVNDETNQGHLSDKNDEQREDEKNEQNNGNL